MVKDSLKLRARLVTLDAEVEQVRQIRNECRAYMTRSTEPIGPAQQIAWWRGLDKNENLLLIFDASGITDGIGWTTVAGYGLMRLIAGKWWLSGGLTREFQGRGLGKDLFGSLIKAANGPSWLEVLEHNTRAFKTYQALGFVETGREGSVITMVRYPNKEA